MIHTQASCCQGYLHLYKQIDVMVCNLGGQKYKDGKFALTNQAEIYLLLSFCRNIWKPQLILMGTMQTL